MEQSKNYSRVSLFRSKNRPCLYALGGQEPLTVREENALAAYFKKKKSKKALPTENKKTKLQDVN